MEMLLRGAFGKQRLHPGQVCARRFATLAPALSRAALSAGEQIGCLPAKVGLLRGVYTEPVEVLAMT